MYAYTPLVRVFMFIGWNERTEYKRTKQIDINGKANGARIKEGRTNIKLNK